jgi:hypothetical protein
MRVRLTKRFCASAFRSNRLEFAASDTLRRTNPLEYETRECRVDSIPIKATQKAFGEMAQQIWLLTY